MNENLKNLLKDDKNFLNEDIKAKVENEISSIVSVDVVIHLHII